MTRIADGVAWRRIAIEGAAIVASILLAFSIDAWWQDRQESQSDLARLKAVYSELERHDSLLDEAEFAHRRTVARGEELLTLLRSQFTDDENHRIAIVIDELHNFYRINAPFGSLQTAAMSGTLARMQDVELSSALASWPTAIEDLAEEQDLSSTVLLVDLFAYLHRNTSMADAYGNRLRYPTGRGTDTIVQGVAIDELPILPFATDFSPLAADVVFHNELLRIMMYGQASAGEAVIFRAQLADLMQRLQACIAVADC